jgi:FAD:protein FMN transferase
MYLPPNAHRAVMVFVSLLMVDAGCATSSRREPALHRYEYAQLHMGVQARLIVYAPTEEAAATAARAAYARVAEIEDIASDYRPTSELMRLCAKAGQGPVKVSEELFTLLSQAQNVSERSGGAFDVTVGPYVQLWRAARKSGKRPTPEALAKARQRVGWRRVQLDKTSQTVNLATPGMRLDLGGLAKGYAGDEAIRVLREHDIERALFEAGGDIVASDAPPGKRGWSIDVVGGDTIEVANRGVSTSGDTEQFVEIDGTRYSHVIDPRTGLGLTQQYAATVLARDGMTSDSLSTAACVLGPEEGAKLAKSYRGATAYIRRGD